MPTTINIILDTCRMKEKTKTFPVKLRVISNCVPKDFQTVFDLTKEQFQGLKAKRLPAEIQVIRDQLAEVEVSAKSDRTDQLIPVLMYQ